MLRRLLDLVAAPALGLTLGLMWLPLRLRATWRRARGRPPVLVWGPAPLIAIPYWSEAARRQGYRSATVVYTHDRLGHPGLFDYYMPHYFRGPLRAIMPYATFVWILCWADIFHVFYHANGFLGSTAFRFLELPILRLFGKRIVALSFGSDVQRASVLQGRFRWSVSPWVADGAAEEAVLKNVLHTLRYAHFAIASGDAYIFLPRYDLCVHLAALDLDSITPEFPQVTPGRPICIFHAPNHRHLKGTAHIIEACEQLRQEGVPIELCLVEGLRNDAALEAYRAAHLVVDQLLIGGYGLFAVEAMALGKPVVCYMREDAIAANPGWDECPIISAKPDTIMQTLRMLAADPARLAELGHASRAYVEKYHSYSYIGGLYDSIYRHLWGIAPHARLSKQAAETARRG